MEVIEPAKEKEKEKESKLTAEEKEEILRKVKELKAKDDLRIKIRVKNMNTGKRFDMMCFEKTKFEIIQKSSKKFQKITDENKDELINEVNNLNFTKILDEIIKNILESKFDFKDVNAIILVLSEFHQIYPKFNTNFQEDLRKQLGESYNETSKPSKNEDEEERKQQRRKALTRLYIEAYLFGLITDFSAVKEIFSKMLSSKNTKEQFYQEFPILVHVMKIFAQPLFNIKSNKIIELIEAGEIEDYTLSTCQDAGLNDKYYLGFKEFYFKKILVFLEEEHKALNDLEKKNFENLKKLDSQNDITSAYQKQRTFYLKYIALINEFAEAMNFDIPELANEKTFRYEEKKKAEMKLEKVNKYDPFCDESEYKFYNCLLTLSPPSVIAKEEDEAKQLTDKDKDKEDKNKKLSLIIQKTLYCDSKETIDELSTELVTSGLFSSYKNRKYFLQVILRSQRSNYAVLKYFARLIANVSVVYKDLQTDCNAMLIDDYNDLNKNDQLKMYEEKIKNSRFICEMVKFGLFPIQNIFDILKKLSEDFKGHNIDILCNIFDNSGRYLYLNEFSHLKFSSFLDSIKQMTHHTLLHNERAFNSISNSISICKPQERYLKKRVKVRSVEEEYIRFLIYQILNKDTVKKVAVLLRKFDWANHEHTIFKVIHKYLIHGNESQIKTCSSLLAMLKDYHPQFIFNLINLELEQIRIGLERNDFNDNQHKILLCMIIGHFYQTKLINSSIVFYTMYMILTFNPEWNNGRKELIADNPLDSPVDTFRVLMIIALLEICGNELSNKKKKEKLDEFIQFLQIYILTKQYLPLEVENRVIYCFERLSDYSIYNDFHEALKDSKNYKGLNFIEDSNKEDGSQEKRVRDRSVGVISQEQGNTGDDPDFRRNETKVKEINVDEELQKIVSESLVKAKGTTTMNMVINPFADVKKKELNKNDSKKFILFTKQNSKSVMKEIEK